MLSKITQAQKHKYHIISCLESKNVDLIEVERLETVGRRDGGKRLINRY
jgi:hypothetical protein